MGVVAILGIAVAMLLQFKTRRRGLLWVSFGAAVLGGCALAVTTFGQKIATIAAAMHAAVPIVVTVLALVFVIIGLADRRADKPETFLMILIPSFASGVGGQFGSAVNEVFGFIASFGGTIGSTGFGA